MGQENIRRGSEAGQVIIFRSRLRADVDFAELEAAGAQMYALVSEMPGFQSMKTFNADDGESLILVEFENEQTLLAWRDHPEHRAIQERGRADFYTEYHMDICESHRAYRFSIADGRVELR
jgi:heme-degrading monooxygenase HmoA